MVVHSTTADRKDGGIAEFGAVENFPKQGRFAHTRHTFQHHDIAFAPLQLVEASVNPSKFALARFPMASRFAFHVSIQRLLSPSLSKAERSVSAS